MLPAMLTLASFARASASRARPSASRAFSVAARSSSSCFFWYRGARLRVSRSWMWSCSRAFSSSALRPAASASATLSPASCKQV